MSDFLLELLSEEIPARMQARASADLARLLEAQLAESGLKTDAIETYATPRRLALIARGLPERTEAVSEEIKGPRASAPPQALEGFLRKTGLARDQLVERDGILFACLERPGCDTADVLAEAVPAIVRAFPWPKSMRWGEDSASTESLRWVRPLQGIVALLGERIVEFEIAGIRSGAATVGHRFHHPGVITIGGAHDYVEKLRACHVIVDPAERARLIAEGARRLAADAGLTLVEDEALVAENAGLTEWPVPLLGSFDPAFLDVPREVIQLTMRTNQKYFALVPPRDGEGDRPAEPDGGGGSAPGTTPPPPAFASGFGRSPSPSRGGLAPAFICVANIEASDGGAAIVDGNRKVLAARLADARYFWEHDLKVPLEEQAGKLSQIVFHEKLGTVADKVERVARLARWLVEQGIVGAASVNTATNRRHPRESGDPPSSSAGVEQEKMDSRFRGNDDEKTKLADLAETAASLCKADLVTGLVGEFPELQGIVGGYLARAQGHPDAIADAIRDHYRPAGQGDEVPTAPVTVAVSLADKLDTLVSFFAIGERPTGSKDPFALRRAALAAIQLILSSTLRLPLRDVVLEARRLLLESLARSRDLILERAWDEEWNELPEVRSPISYEQSEGLVAVANIPDELHFPGPGKNEWFVHPGAIRDHGESFTRIGSLVGLTDLLTEYMFDRVEEIARRGGTRVDLIRAVIPKEYVYFDLNSMIEGITIEGSPHGPAKPLIHRVRKIDPFGPDDLVRLLARVKALQSFVETEEGADLLAGYKRGTNILKRENWLRDDEAAAAPSYDLLPEESALIAALDAAEPRARAAVEAEDFEGAMAALASLRGPIDAFFDKVTVNDPDPVKRAARLDLLARMRDAFHQVADFSRIEG